jgi:hypothetical protein
LIPQYPQLSKMLLIQLLKNLIKIRRKNDYW